MTDPGDLLDLARAVAQEAGALVARMRLGTGARVSATKSSPTDVVTAADTAAEELIRTRLLGARPGDGILGEEGALATPTSGVRWVVDPIDGTVNYLYGRAAYAVSIAAERDGVTVAGVVHQPALGRTWTAVRGGGAYLDGRAIVASACSELGQALVATGFAYDTDRRRRQAEILTGVLPRVRDIRRDGAASLDLCAVAGGQADAYYEQGLSLWDHAAGALIATEAGAWLGGPPGGVPGPVLVTAAAPGLAAAWQELLGDFAWGEGG